MIENGLPIDQLISSVAADPAAPPGLVTIVFDRIDQQRAQTTRRSVVDFIDTSLPPNVKTRVMVAGQKLLLVENFTTDKAAIKRAVDRAMSPSVKSLAERSDQLRKELTASPGGEEKLARMSADTLDQANRFITESGSSSPVISLLHIARAQRSMPGRKLVLYVSNGLYLPPGKRCPSHYHQRSQQSRRHLLCDRRADDTCLCWLRFRAGESAAVVDATRRPNPAPGCHGPIHLPPCRTRTATTNLNTMEAMSSFREQTVGIADPDGENRAGSLSLPRTISMELSREWRRT